MKLDVDDMITEAYVKKLMEEDPVFQGRVDEAVKKAVIHAIGNTSLEWLIENAFENVDLRPITRKIEEGFVKMIKDA